ncbi:MAG: hypothetical protein AAF944_12205 [Bacteroidota bacterium]
MKQKITTLSILFITLNSITMAQEKSMEKLNRMIGNWSCVETYHAGGWSETEVVSTSAHDLIEYGINNQYITADYSSESAIGSYAAYAMIYFDASKESYALSFFDKYQDIISLKWLALLSKVAEWERYAK